MFPGTPDAPGLNGMSAWNAALIDRWRAERATSANRGGGGPVHAGCVFRK